MVQILIEITQAYQTTKQSGVCLLIQYATRAPQCRREGARRKGKHNMQRVHPNVGEKVLVGKASNAPLPLPRCRCEARETTDSATGAMSPIRCHCVNRPLGVRLRGAVFGKPPECE